MPEALGHARDGSTFPIHSCARQLPAHDAGTAVTAQMMWDKATGSDGGEGAEHPQVRDFALEATANCPDRDDWAQARAIYQAVKERIRFRGERGETVQNPVLTLKWQAGDCDDFTTLICAMLMSIGIPARIQTVSLPGHRDYRHVYAVAGIRRNGQVVEWRALDATVPHTAAGWQPPNITRRRFFGGTTNELRRGHTMRGYLPDPGLSGFWSKMVKGSLHAGTVGLRTAEGFATGGPAGAVKAGATATLHYIAPHNKLLQQASSSLQQRIPGLSGYGPSVSIPPRRYAPTPMPPPIPTDPTWHGRDRVYLNGLGDAGMFDGLNTMSTTQKVIGGAAALVLLLALTQ